MIADNEWDEWLHEVVVVLNNHEKLFTNIIDFLGKIKHLIEDCSRFYTAMFILDTLHQVQDKTAEFEKDVQGLQTVWNKIMDPLRESRKVLMAQKCLEFFAANCKDLTGVTSVELLVGGEEAVAKWDEICKRCFDQGLTNDKSYKEFMVLLLVEMTKY